MPRILIVEDQKRLLQSLRLGLEEEGYEVLAAPTGEDGYYIYEGDNTVAVAPPDVNAWTISGWDSTVQHCYAVAAFNELGQSALSNTVCAGPMRACTVDPAWSRGRRTTRCARRMALAPTARVHWWRRRR